MQRLKALIPFALCLFLLLWLLPNAAAAPLPNMAENTLSEIETAAPQEAQQIIEGIDFFAAGGLNQAMGNLLLAAQDALSNLLKNAFGGAAALLLVVFLCNFAKMFSFEKHEEKVQRCTEIAGALAVSVLAAGNLGTMMALGRETISAMSDFSKVLLPLLAAAVAASGGVTTAAVGEVATNFFADILLTCINTILVPMLYFYIGVITANAVLRESSLEQIGQMIKKVIVWILMALLTGFTAYLTISGILSGTTDAMVLKTAKFAISGALPVVGGILSDAAASVLNGAAVVKNAMGIVGMIAVIAMCMTPFLQVGVQYLSYQITALLAEVIDQTNLSRYIRDIGNAFGLLLGMTGAGALLLLIAIATSIMAVSRI